MTSADRDDAIAGSTSPDAALVEAVEQVLAPMSRLQSLQRYATGLVTIDTLDEVARALMDDGVDAAGAIGGSLMIVEGTRLRLISQRNLPHEIAEEWSDFSIQPTADPISDAVTARAPAFYPDRGAFLAAYPHLRATIESTQHEAWAVLPLLHDGQPVGSLGFTFDSSDPFDAAEELALFTIADLATQAVIRVLSMAEQRRAFVSLHRALLDLDLPDLTGVRTASTYLAATRTSDTGGDWFNATELDDGRLLFVIGDVAHHGTAAVGEMGRVRAVVLAYALEEHPTNRIADLTTLTMSKLSSTFATACIVIFDPRTRELTWTNAGHPYPLVIPKTGSPRFLTETHGPPLGVDPTTVYERTSVSMAPGDTLLLYSDGLIERRDHGVDADFERLRRAVPLGAPRPQGLVDELVDRLHPSALHDDDIAVLAVTVD